MVKHSLYNLPPLDSSKPIATLTNVNDELHGLAVRAKFVNDGHRESGRNLYEYVIVQSKRIEKLKRKLKQSREMCKALAAADADAKAQLGKQVAEMHRLQRYGGGVNVELQRAKQSLDGRKALVARLEKLYKAEQEKALTDQRLLVAANDRIRAFEIVTRDQREVVAKLRKQSENQAIREAALDDQLGNASEHSKNLHKQVNDLQVTVQRLDDLLKAERHIAQARGKNNTAIMERERALRRELEEIRYLADRRLTAVGQKEAALKRMGAEKVTREQRIHDLEREVERLAAHRNALSHRVDEVLLAHDAEKVAAKSILQENRHLTADRDSLRETLMKEQDRYRALRLKAAREAQGE